MKILKALIIVCLFSFILFPQIVFAIGLEAAVGIWNQGPQGDIAYKGQALSIEDELKYGDETKVFGRVKIDMPLIIPNIYLMATPMKLKADGLKSTTFTFGDRTFTGNVSFSSTLQLDHYDIAFYYGVPFLKTATGGLLNVDLGLNLRIIDLYAEINQPQTGLKESKSFTHPVPMVFLAAQINLIDKLSFEAEIRGITYSSDHYYDLIGRVKYKTIGPAFIGAGYRVEDLKIVEKDIHANIRFGGPFAEIGVEF